MSREARAGPARLAALGLGGAVLGLAAGRVLATLARPERRRAPPRPAPARQVARRNGTDDITVRSGRRLNRAAGVLAFSVLADSALEHYRGSFHNKAMLAPLATSTLSLLASAHGTSDRRSGSHPARDTIYVLAGLTGLAGTGFHVFNVGKRLGGFSWLNLFYGAPIGAPAALVLSGMLGFLAERVRDNSPQAPARILGWPAGRISAALTAAGLIGTAAEAALLHFRGAYHDPFMFLPVTVPPAGAALLVITAARPDRAPRLTRWWLRLTALLGLGGAGFHAFGVSRNMGGWRNWSQNLLNGPPVPAPPSFTGLALAGLAALSLIEEHPDA